MARTAASSLLRFWLRGSGDHMLPALTASVALAPFIGLLVNDGRVVSGSDFVSCYIPFHEFARAEVMSGRFPHWIPFLACGAPLHAQQHGTLLYPLSAPFVLLFGANAGIKVSLFLHLGICFWGQYALARVLRVSSAAAGFAAVAAAWSIFAVDQLAAGHITFVVGYALTPWFIWSLLRYLERPCAATAGVLGGAVALFELGSHPQALYYALGAGACWLGGWSISAAATKKRLHAVVWLLVAVATAVSLSAAQWLPACELVRDGMSESARGGAQHAAMYSMDGADLARVIVPRFKGDEALGIEPFADGGYEHERGAYLGLLIVPLALFGLSRSDAARWQWGAAWLCVLAAELALANESPLWELFSAIVPGLRWFRCQGRIFAVVAVVGPLLAARGLDGLLLGSPRGGRLCLWGLASLCFAATLVLGAALWSWLARVNWRDYVRYASLNLSGEYLDLAALTVVTLIALWAAAMIARTFPRVAYALPLLALMTDLYEHNVRHFKLVPPNGPSQTEFASGTHPQRFVFAPGDLRFSQISLQYSSAVPLAVQSRTRAVNTNDGAILPGAVARLYAAIEGRPATALAISGCDWALIEPHRRWRQLTDAMPRVRFISGSVAALCERPIAECDVDDIHAMRDVLAGNATVRYEDPRRIEVDIDAAENGALVVADTYYPGWRATVDGRSAEIFAAHGVFRGVRLTKGRHHVQMVFKPASFRIGLMLSGIGLALLCGLAWVALNDLHRARTIVYHGAGDA